MENDLDKSLAKFKGPGHRSKVMNDVWPHLCWLCRSTLTWHLTSCNATAGRDDVMCHHDVIWRLSGQNTDKEGTTREGRQRSGVFIESAKLQTASRIGGACTPYTPAFSVWKNTVCKSAPANNKQTNRKYQTHYLPAMWSIISLLVNLPEVIILASIGQVFILEGTISPSPHLLTIRPSLQIIINAQIKQVKYWRF